MHSQLLKPVISTLKALFCVLTVPECSPGNDRHPDDGVHGGDGERGEGDGLHSSVLAQRRRAGNALRHRGRSHHLAQQGEQLALENLPRRLHAGDTRKGEVMLLPKILLLLPGN